MVIRPSRDDDGQFAVRVVTGLLMGADACVHNGYVGGCVVARRSPQLPSYVSARP